MPADTPAPTRTAHEHRLGPFHAESDPSEHDDLIAAAVGAAWGSGCEPCLEDGAARLASSVPAMTRLLELHARSWRDGTDLGPAAGPPYGAVGIARFRSLFPMYEHLASLIEASAQHREETITRLDPGARSVIAGEAVRTLVSQWAIDFIRAEQDARADAWRARFAQEPVRWGWAVLREIESVTSDGETFIYDRQSTVSVTATAGLEATDYLLEPVDVVLLEMWKGRQSLHQHGWGLVGEWETVPLNPGPLDRNTSRLNRCWTGRVRYPAIDPDDHEPVPYAEDLRWPLESDRHYPERTDTGSPPGRVRAALRLLTGGTETDDAAAAAAREDLEAYRQRLHEALIAHGWPQAGVDDARLTRVMLAWVAADPNEARRQACIERLSADVEAGTADPTHLEALKASAALPTVELYDAVCCAYPDS